MLSPKIASASRPLVASSAAAWYWSCTPWSGSVVAMAIERSPLKTIAVCCASSVEASGCAVQWVDKLSPNNDMPREPSPVYASNTPFPLMSVNATPATWADSPSAT